MKRPAKVLILYELYVMCMMCNVYICMSAYVFVCILCIYGLPLFIRHITSYIHMSLFGPIRLIVFWK